MDRDSFWYYLSFERVISNIIFLIWVIILIGVIVYRIVMGENNMSLLIYFTNWSWLFQTVFYTLDYIGRILLLCNLESGYNMRYGIIFLFFWFINGTVWLVLILVTIIIQQNPQLLINAANQLGGLGQLGEVVNAHILIHYVPGIMVLLFLVLERDIIARTIVDFYMVRPHFKIYASVCNGLYIFYITVLTVAVPFVVYSIIFDPRQVYGISTSIGVLIVISLAVIFIFNVLPFLTMVQRYVFILRGQWNFKTT